MLDKQKGVQKEAVVARSPITEGTGINNDRAHSRMIGGTT
jgi:hypothetical protein